MIKQFDILLDLVSRALPSKDPVLHLSVNQAFGKRAPALLQLWRAANNRTLAGHSPACAALSGRCCTCGHEELLRALIGLEGPV